MSYQYKVSPLLVGVAIGFIALCCIAMIRSINMPKPCSEYTNSPLSQIPIRCFEELIGSEE